MKYLILSLLTVSVCSAFEIVTEESEYTKIMKLKTAHYAEVVCSYPDKSPHKSFNIDKVSFYVKNFKKGDKCTLIFK